MDRVVSLLLAFAAVAAVPDRAAAQISDRKLLERVTDAVRTYPAYGVFDSIDVDVRERAVTLSGRVTDSRKREDVENLVRRIDGLKTLTNGIGVLPVSQSDDELRYRVARSIYNHPMFWIHGQRSIPPIHIVVERGRITLTGVAGNEAERAMAMSLAQVPGALGVTDRLRVAP
jgi:hyperosmotically inducible protein